MISLTNPVEDIQTGPGLNAYLARDVTRPTIPEPAQFTEFDEASLLALNDARIDFMTDGLTVKTPVVRETLRRAKVVMRHNRRAWSGRRGLLLTGEAATGKTRACVALMRTVFLAFQRQNPGTWQDYYPVVYLCVPSGCNSKALMRQFAAFFEIDYDDGTSEDTLRRLVLAALQAYRTVLIVIDELHNLVKMDGQAGAVIDTLKDLANHPFGTFVYAGVNVARYGLLAGARGGQIRGRFSRIRAGAYGNTTPEERKAWRGIVRGFANALPLAENDPAAIMRLTPWLHETTGGNIATLQFLFDQVVADLIDAGDPFRETVTRKLLEDAILDIQAEDLHASTEFPYEVVG